MKKGQAAIEFFVTYGWAILAFVIVLGYLMTSGILTPNYLVSEECTFGNNLPCDFALYNVGDSTHLALRIFNGFPDKIRIDEISIQSRDGNQEFELLDFSPTEIQSGGSVTFEAALPGNQIEENVETIGNEIL